jgi:hypothetical protein
MLSPRNTPCQDGLSLLLLACVSEPEDTHVDIVEYLLDNGADPNDVTNWGSHVRS